MIMDDEIFVFGSNEAGRHGKGAALEALKKYGAKYGQGFGLMGMSFGIPTKDKSIRSLTLVEIEDYVVKFKGFANSRPDLKFYVTPVGCGLAGFHKGEIRPLFDPLPANCRYAETW